MEFSRLGLERKGDRVADDEPSRQLLEITRAHHLVDFRLKKARDAVPMLLDQLLGDQEGSRFNIIVFHDPDLARRREVNSPQNPDHNFDWAATLSQGIPESELRVTRRE